MTREQTILVTGGASGIGFAIVEAILAEGWRVIVSDFDEKNLERCRDALKGFGDKARFERLNVADEAGVVACIARCNAEFGPVTGVVNSAGIGSDIPAFETTTDVFRRFLEVNLIGSFVVAREAAKAMKENGGGSIINISSVSGLIGNDGRAAYGASKGGTILMTKVLAVEWAPYGIRVNSIAPGPIETPLVRDMHTQAARDVWTRMVPQNRYGTPEEIAGTAVYLLDPRKSSFVTGQTIAVDGGLTIAGIIAAEHRL